VAEASVAEVLVQFTDLVVGEDGSEFVARACGGRADDGLWHGWIEFLPVSGGEVLRSARETTQPNRQAAMYWATGLSAVYLEGALERALRTLEQRVGPTVIPPVHDEPAPDLLQGPPVAGSILNPFSVYRKGEPLLRAQLGALAPRHLVNIIRAHNLSELSATALNNLDTSTLIELIVSAVRAQVESSAAQ
jgi:hypothetical protein